MVDSHGLFFYFIQYIQYILSNPAGTFILESSYQKIVVT